MTFHQDNTLPKYNEILVFGSNLAGRHGKGAAKVAKDCFGAVIGNPEGLQGREYAIPTKDQTITQPIPLPYIKESINRFIRFAKQFPELQFFITRIGCGLAGFQDSQIAPMFNPPLSNCSFPEEWKQYLKESE